MNGVVQLTMLKAKKTMSKYIICILIVINVTSCKKLATLSPVDEDRVNKEIIDWEQRGFTKIAASLLLPFVLMPKVERVKSQ